MRLTDNQLKILDCLIKGNQDGTKIDLDQLLDRLGDEYGWYTSKPSLQFSLRQLIQAGMVERLGRELRRQRMRRLLECTDLGRAVMGQTPALSL
jgi:Fe2+ or Zn2+ uptake regulation protein